MLGQTLKRIAGKLQVAAAGFACTVIVLLNAASGWAAPAAPADLTVVNGNGEVSLAWSPSSGADSYLLYRSSTSGGPYTFVAQTRSVSLSDHGLGNGARNYYVASSLDASGQSGYSAEVAAMPTANVLSAPTAVRALAGNGQATLSWSPVTSAVAYNVYRSTTPGGPYSLLTPAAPGPSFTDSGLVNGTRYYYVIQTLSTNSGAWSDEVDVVPNDLLPTAPTNLQATPGSTWASLTWTASAGANGYTVYRSTTVGGPYVFAGFTPTTGYEDFGLANGTSYYYVVAAVNAAGQSAWSAEQLAAVSDMAMPHAATLSAMRGNGTVALTWSGAHGAVTYILRRGEAPGGPYTVAVPVSNNTNYTDSALVNGSSYYYVVEALNSSEYTATSNEVVMTPLSLLPPPSNLTAIPGNSEATVTWSPVPGASGYNVTVSYTPGGSGVAGGYQSGPSFTATGLSNSILYYIRIQTVGASGYYSGSSEVSVTPLGTLPKAPLSLNSTGGNSQLSLTWTAVPGVTGYHIYRTSEGNSWPVSPLATTSGTLYTDSGLTNGTAYQYVVAAVKAAGEGARSQMASQTPNSNGTTIAPGNVAAMPGNTQINVTWDPVAGASGYTVTVSETPGGAQLFPSAYQSGPSFTVTDLTNGHTYYLRIQAIAPSGYYSAYSAEVSATPSVSLPLAPTGLAITGGTAS